jgi:hypothetical protein
MPAKPVLVISDKVRLELNQLLNELSAIEAEAAKQEQARVPEMQQVMEVCRTCKEQIVDFKAVNFPNKK